MDIKDKAKFAEIMYGLAENFGDSVSPAGLKMRFAAMEKFSIEEVERAALSLVASRKFTKMPPIADFLEHIGGGSAEDHAQVQAGIVLNAIRSKGSYATVNFDDKTTNAVIAQGFGGWVKLCSELTTDKEGWFQKDFCKIYQSYKRTGIKQQGCLPGAVDEHNKGFIEHKNNDPVMIGEILDYPH